MSLKGVAKQTLAVLEAGVYTAPSGAQRHIAEAQARAVQGTRLYRPEALAALVAQPGPQGAPAPTDFWEVTTQVAAQRWVSEGAERVVLLNFASARNPGGGFLNGAKAQEEDVTRCSGLYPCLLAQPLYYGVNRSQHSMLYTDHIIYSPDVPFFRVRNREFIEEPFVASVITAPAPNAGQHRRKKGGEDEIEVALRRRAAYVLAVCEAEGHRNVLLGAWGCGVFRNDPNLVASAFEDALGGRFAGAFDRVVFAVISREEHVLTAFRDRYAHVLAS